MMAAMKDVAGRQGRASSEVRLEREHQRVKAVVPVRLAHGPLGVTRDLSPGGLFFVINGELFSGQTLRMTLEFESPSGTLFLNCTAEIVRVETVDGKYGCAARIVESRLERHGLDETEKPSTPGSM
jgi:PilZ domain-containing protein